MSRGGGGTIRKLLVTPWRDEFLLAKPKAWRAFFNFRNHKLFIDNTLFVENSILKIGCGYAAPSSFVVETLDSFFL